MRYPPVWLFALPFVSGLLLFSLGWSRIWQGEPTIVDQAKLAAFVMVAGSFLYAMKCRHQLMYGLTEVLAGLGLAWYLVNVSFNAFDQRAVASFSVLAALYVVVRGYDNIYRSLKPGTTALKYWNTFFFDKSTDAKL